MTDIETLDAAIQAIATKGFATVTVGNQTVTVKSIRELLEWRDKLQEVSATSVDRPGLGIRFQAIKPYYP